VKPSVFIAASAAVILLLGLMRLWYTFRGPLLHPRDPELIAKIDGVTCHHLRNHNVAGMDWVQRNP
jgi:hypothetical protein